MNFNTLNRPIHTTFSRYCHLIDYFVLYLFDGSEVEVKYYTQNITSSVGLCDSVGMLAVAPKASLRHVDVG